MLQQPVEGFENVLNWLYLPYKPSASGGDSEEDLGHGLFLLKDVVERARHVVARSESGEAIAVEDTSDGVGRVSKGALSLLKRHLKVLEDMLAGITVAETK